MSGFRLPGCFANLCLEGPLVIGCWPDLPQDMLLDMCASHWLSLVNFLSSDAEKHRWELVTDNLFPQPPPGDHQLPQAPVAKVPRCVGMMLAGMKLGLEDHGLALAPSSQRAFRFVVFSFASAGEQQVAQVFRKEEVVMLSYQFRSLVHCVRCALGYVSSDDVLGSLEIRKPLRDHVGDLFCIA